MHIYIVLHVVNCLYNVGDTIYNRVVNTVNNSSFKTRFGNKMHI